MSGSLFVGWPLEAPDPGGRLIYAADLRCLREALWNLLLTNPGERLMRPTFGAGLNQWIGQPNTVTTRQLIATSVTSAVNRWEQRVALGGVSVTVDPDDPANVVVSLSYTPRGLAVAPQQLSLTVTLGGV